MKRTPLSDYLARRALISPWRIEGTQRNDFVAAVVIPALAEGESLWATLRSLATNPVAYLEQTLVLVVFNQRQDAADALRRCNDRDLARLRRAGADFEPLPLAWVDACGPGLELPNKGGGVGLARRLGFDLALSRLAPEQSDTFLVSLDADTLVQPDYLPALYGHFRTSGSGGAVLPYEHQPGRNDAEQRAIERYELFLRHYVFGLQLAGSPYAFHAIGSALACRSDAYVKAGGMNRRQAGEDFYFLQQLAKTSGVAPVQGTLVYPSPRPSQRTPFGTGRSIARLLAAETDAVSFYHPDCFRILGCWLQLMAEHLTWSAEALLQGATAISGDLGDYLRGLDFSTAWERLRRNHSRPEALHKAFHGWFDGLVSLRLIHYLSSGSRSRCQPEVSLPQLLRWGGLEEGGDLADQLAILRRYQQGVG